MLSLLSHRFEASDLALHRRPA